MTFVFFDPVSKSLFVLETTGLIPKLGTVSTKYSLKAFVHLISEVSILLFLISNY